jgi:two-component system, OmpR family, response regulator
MDTPKLIFVVDDDPFINTLVIRRFASESFKIEPYGCGEDCLDALYKNPDLIILDYSFANNGRNPMNGMEVFDKIKELKPEIPVIVLSGQEKGEIVFDFARKGIDDYVIKDIDLFTNLDIALGELFDRKSIRN